MEGICTDHDMMTVKIPYHSMKLQPPLAPLPPSDPLARKLKVPMTKSDSIALSSALRTQQQVDYMMLAHQTSDYVLNGVLPHWEHIERLCCTYSAGQLC